MYVPDIYITISRPGTSTYVPIDFVHVCEIEKSWATLTDTCKITLPRKLKLDDKMIQNYIKSGDEVTIVGGYDGRLSTEFTGYVTKIEATTPIVIHCEDEMWKLKQRNFSKVYKQVSLSGLISELAPNYIKSITDMQLGDIVIENASPAKVFDMLKQKFGIATFFKNNALYSGLQAPYPANPIKHVYRLQDNVIDNNLTFRRAEEVRLKVKAISTKPDGKKIEVELGDFDGEQRTLNYYNLPEKELKQVATAEIERLKKDGYSGTLTTFFEPWATHGNVAIIQDADYPEKDGEYFIDKVVVSMGVDGYRRNISLGKRAGV